MWMNLTCTVLSLIVATLGCFPDGNGNYRNKETPNWVLHATSVAVLLAWSELMLLIGRSPTYGYYSLMFSAVLQNVIKVLLTFVCLVIGFALSFSIQFHQRNDEQFADPWRALVKTVVMMMGEFEYGDLFSSDNDGGGNRALPTTSRFIFLLFVILASIVLMNLMIGVAVSDIQSLQAEGRARRLEKQAEFLRGLEKVISSALRARWIPACTRRFFERKRRVAASLIIQPERNRAAKTESKQCRKLPCKLVESIVAVAVARRNRLMEQQRAEEEKRKGEEEEDLASSARGGLSIVIEKMKNIIQAYENKARCKENTVAFRRDVAR